jgi:hypothetical protein
LRESERRPNGAATGETPVVISERGSAGELALRIADQGWAGLLPILAQDAAPNVRLKPENANPGRGVAGPLPETPALEARTSDFAAAWLVRRYSVSPAMAAVVAWHAGLRGRGR